MSPKHAKVTLSDGMRARSFVDHKGVLLTLDELMTRGRTIAPVVLFPRIRMRIFKPITE